MVYLPIHEWLIFMINVSKYTIHESYGLDSVSSYSYGQSTIPCRGLCFFLMFFHLLAALSLYQVPFPPPKTLFGFNFFFGFQEVFKKMPPEFCSFVNEFQKRFRVRF